MSKSSATETSCADLVPAVRPQEPGHVRLGSPTGLTQPRTMTRLRDLAQSSGPVADQEARARNLIGNHLADTTDLGSYPI